MTQKTVLGIDTSTLSASVAIVRGPATESDKSAQVLHHAASSVNTHSQRLLSLIDEGLAACSLTLADIDALVVGAGPGSFTGLRIGMATAKGLAFATGKPLWAVSSLAALALSATDESATVDAQTLVLPIMDARRLEVFVGFYRLAGAGVEATADEIVIAPEELNARLDAVLADASYVRAVALGDGLTRYHESLGGLLANPAVAVLDSERTPAAAAVAQLALCGSHEDIVQDGAPTYIRLSEAEIKYPDGNPGGAFRARILDSSANSGA